MRETEGHLRLKSHVYLQGTAIPFSISKCLCCQAAGGIYLDVSFLLVSAVPLEALIVFPTGLQTKEQETIIMSGGEGTRASPPGQVNVELDCRLSLPSIR